jgi:hypothetical protein
MAARTADTLWSMKDIAKLIEPTAPVKRPNEKAAS